MRCRKAERLLSRRMDGTLPSEDRLTLERHLERCASCSALAARVTRTWDALGKLGEPGPAPDDWARIQARVDASRAEIRLPDWVLAHRHAAAAASLLAVALLGATGGALVTRKALAPFRAEPTEAKALAETLGDLPWDSPAAGLAASLGAPPRQEVRP